MDMAKARRTAAFTRAEIVRVLRAYEEVGLPPPRMIVRSDGIAFEPMSGSAASEKLDRDEPADEVREPWIM